MKFRTTIEAIKSHNRILYGDKLILIGSCFSDNIGQKLKESKFDVTINPLGISYNPISIQKQLTYLSGEEKLKKEDIVRQGDYYYHFDFHSSYRNSDPQSLIELLNNNLANTRTLFEKGDKAFITLGTAIVYCRKGAVVSNCHKQNLTLFDKSMLSFEALSDALADIKKELTRLNPSLEIIYTVSPIRHTKEGLVNNQLSKSLLRSAIGEGDYHYFPSYEILIDDLRDYRFYAHDMIHPSSSAIEYIWDYFKDCYCSDELRKQMDKIAKINNKLSHKAFNPKSKEHQAFLKKLRSEIIGLETENQKVSFKEELNHLNDMIL